jgi:hypothetical protein
MVAKLQTVHTRWVHGDNVCQVADLWRPGGAALGTRDGPGDVGPGLATGSGQALGTVERPLQPFSACRQCKPAASSCPVNMNDACLPVNICGYAPAPTLVASDSATGVHPVTSITKR